MGILMIWFKIRMRNACVKCLGGQSFILLQAKWYYYFKYTSRSFEFISIHIVYGVATCSKYPAERRNTQFHLWLEIRKEHLNRPKIMQGFLFCKNTIIFYIPYLAFSMQKYILLDWILISLSKNSSIKFNLLYFKSIHIMWSFPWCT